MVQRRRVLRRRTLGLGLAAGAASLIFAAAVFAVVNDSGSLDVQVADKTGYAVDQTASGGIVEYIGDSNTSFGSSGTGTFGTFLQTQDAPSEEGYNTDGTSEFDTGSSPQFNRSILVSAIPTVPCESLDGNVTTSGLCWELFADINDSNAKDPTAAHIQLTDLEVWFTGNKNITGYDQSGPGFAAPAAKVYDFAGNILINDVNQGSGRGDLRYLIPLNGISIPSDCSFGNAACSTYFVVYTEWGDTDAGTYSSDSGFEEWKVKTYPFVSVSKTATTTFTRTFTWDIDKSVTPDSWDLFTGDSGTSDYTVTVNKTGYVDSAFAVSGTITIENPGDLDAVVTDVGDVISGAPTTATVVCPEAFPFTIGKGDEVDCTYSTSLPDSTSQTNTASVTLQEGTVFQGTAAVTFGSPTTAVYDTVHVTDTVQGDLGEFTDGQSKSYSHTFSCDADKGENDNTATITETGDSDDATVTVNCYALSVSKDADTSLDRKYTWSIDKTSDDPTSLTLNPGESYNYPYKVTVDVTGHSDSGWAASGNIHVQNPAPIAATINSVSDAISGGIAADVTCGVSFPYELAANTTLDCTYSADLPNADSRTNTATATLQNHDYASDGTATDAGTTDATGTASVSFSGADMTEIDECIDVSDTYAGDLGTVCVGDAPKTFSYSRTIQPAADFCGEFTVDNTASFETSNDENDTTAHGSDDWSVDVTVPCPEGCTLTQGYWKTHSSYGPAKKADPNWALVGGPDAPFFLSTDTWYEVFWTPPKGNPYYQLAHQYEAAKLNILSGAGSTSSVDAAITWAETFFNTYTPTNWPKNLKSQIISKAGTLGSYNEGDIGPGHCSEDSTAQAAPA